MKLHRLLLPIVTLGICIPSFAQSTEKPSNVPVVLPPPEQPALTKFDLDFAGGTPGELIAAIGKARGQAVNAVVLVEDANLQLPALKMRNINIQQLFSALYEASQVNRSITTTDARGIPVIQNFGSSYGFQSKDRNPNDTSIWYFRASLGDRFAPPTLTVSKFYQLTPYLKRGLTVEDITTAVQAGWRMAQVTTPPALNFHKETGLLIAVGKPENLATIEDVLEALKPETPQAVAEPGNPKSGS